MKKKIVKTKTATARINCKNPDCEGNMKVDGTFVDSGQDQKPRFILKSITFAICIYCGYQEYEGQVEDDGIAIITENDFAVYEDVRITGMTNMLVTETVSALSGLTRQKIRTIIKNYNKLCKKFPDVRKLQ